MGRIGLDWAIQDMTGLQWTIHERTILDWTWLDWTILHWTVLDQIRLDWIGLVLSGLDYIGLDHSVLVWTGLYWSGPVWTRLYLEELTGRLSEVADDALQSFTLRLIGDSIQIYSSCRTNQQSASFIPLCPSFRRYSHIFLLTSSFTCVNCLQQSNHTLTNCSQSVNVFEME